MKTSIIVLSNCINRINKSIISGLVFQNQAFSCFFKLGVHVHDFLGCTSKFAANHTLQSRKSSQIYNLSQYSYSKLHPCFPSETSLDSRSAEFVIFSSLAPLLSIFCIFSNPPSILKLWPCELSLVRTLLLGWGLPWGFSQLTTLRMTALESKNVIDDFEWWKGHSWKFTTLHF